MSAVALKAKLHLNPHAMERAKKLLRGAAEHVHQHRATIGLHEGEASQPKLDYHGNATSSTLGEVAAYHELVGDRSFLRTWFDQNLSRLKTEMTAAMRAEYQGDTSAVEKQSIAWALELRAWVEEQGGKLRPLADSTVAEKTAAGLSRPSVPLYATGQLVAAIRARLDGADLD